MNDDLRRAVDDLKQRLPIEDLVGSYVPGLKRQGALWVACCPFHEERTPSFKVDPRRGTWRCYGACGAGGDLISFVERAHRVEFLEALEILAQRAGVELPRRAGPGRVPEGDASRPLYEALERAERFFRARLMSGEGGRARAYVRSRGLADETLEAFGLGWAGPGGPEGLLESALRTGVPLVTLIAAGLARAGEAGRASDFFFGRLMIPVRDLEGRTVGFGARRLDDSAGGPKYVNSPETELFKKSRLIYALDRGLEAIRRSGHMVLVEGYTDVMAAHQMGLQNVVAVLGTATTAEHATAVRRSGARRISLVFDGDEAGSRATYKALHGLLPLGAEIDVVRLPGGEDPCDLLVREGAAAFAAHLERATGWFEQQCSAVALLSGQARWSQLDQLLELLLRLPRPLEREARIEELALRLGVPALSVRAQIESLPARRREELRRETAPAPALPVPGARREGDGGNRRLLRAWRGLIAAALVDGDLASRAERWSGRCPFDQLGPILEAAVAASRRGVSDEHERVAAVLAALGDGPARHVVVPLLEEAGPRDELSAFFADNVALLVELERSSEVAEQREGALLGDGERRREGQARLHATLRRLKIEGQGSEGREAARGESPARAS